MVRTLFASLALLLSSGCYEAVVDVFEAGDVTIHRITVGTSGSFVLEGPEGNLLIDAGTDQDFAQLDRGLGEAGFQPGDIGVLLITHGHFDHAGAARSLQDKWGVEVAIHKEDEKLLKAGVSGPNKIVMPEGYLIQAVSDMTYPPTAPDHLITGPTDLSLFGVAGKIHEVPGHTPGSIAVTLPTGDAFTGDLYRTEEGVVLTHMFTDDLPGDRASVRRILDEEETTRFFPAHGPEVDDTAVRTWLEQSGS